MSFEEIVKKLSPEVYESLKTGVELGRWPNGQALTTEQRQISMEAVIRYEVEQNIPVEQRVGYIAPKKPKQPEAAALGVQEFNPQAKQ